MVTEAGLKIAGRYELVKCIASSNMSEVYEAYDTELNRVVVVKVLAPSLIENEEFIERFHKEAQAAAGLSHPNIVDVYDLGKDIAITKNTTSVLYFIVMEYFSERTLFDLLKQKGQLPIPQVLSITADIAQALYNAHSYNIIHQDVKPSNILIDDAGQIGVTDFGIAHFLEEEGMEVESQNGSSSNSIPNSIVGTAAYFSLEQASGHKVDARSDLYSLGVVMYEMLMGKVPFVGETPTQVAQMHIHEAPQITRDLPAPVKNILSKLLAKEPADRFQSGKELLKAIEGITRT